MTVARKVIASPKYLLLSLVVGVGVIILMTWLPNMSLISATMSSSTLTIFEKSRILISLLGAFQTNFTPVSRLLTVTIATLTGVQIALLTFYIRQTARLYRDVGISVLGTITSLFGVGCLSCGSILFTTFFGLSSTALILGYLPFHGLEFSIIGIGILLLSIKHTMSKVNQPIVCDTRKIN